jgi:hypothetical protein
MNTPAAFVHPAEIVGIQATILVIMHLASRARRSDADSDANVFRIVPGISWLMAIASPLISALYVIAAFVPSYHHRKLFIGFSLMFFVVAVYGVYCVSLRIRLTEDSVIVSSIFGTRVTLFYDIASIEDKLTNRIRILKVKNTLGKQILYAADWYVADYPMLVELLKDDVSSARRIKPIRWR